MLSFTLLTFAFAALSPVVARVVPRATPPSGWLTDLLEPYNTYHTRYMALGCQDQHGKPFFHLCCHPLLANQTLETARPAQCIPHQDPVPTSPAYATPKPDPTPTTSPAYVTPKPDPTPAPSPSPSPSPNTGGGAVQVNVGGVATYFYQNGVAGACGTVHSDSDLVAAIDIARYGYTGARSSLCGKKVKITNISNKHTVIATIADACPTCENGNSIDLSTAAFQALATLEQGEVTIEWSFVN